MRLHGAVQLFRIRFRIKRIGATIHRCVQLYPYSCKDSREISLMLLFCCFVLRCMCTDMHMVLHSWMFRQSPHTRVHLHPPQRE